MGLEDQCILVTHQPRWLADWFWDEMSCHNLRQLVRGHLRGRARVHLAGRLCLTAGAPCERGQEWSRRPTWGGRRMSISQVGVAVNPASTFTGDHNLQQLQVTCKSVHGCTGPVAVMLAVNGVPVTLQHDFLHRACFCG